MTSLAEKKNIANEYICGNPYETLLEILPLKEKIGFDTTQIFLGFDESEQKKHSIRVQPVAKGDANRAARRSDVIVTYVQKISENIRVSVDTHTNIVTLQIGTVPKPVFHRKKDELILELTKILRLATGTIKIRSR